MTLLLIGALLAVLSTVIIIAINKELSVLAGVIGATTTFLNVYAIVSIAGDASTFKGALLYSIGVGIGTAGTVLIHKNRGA